MTFPLWASLGSALVTVAWLAFFLVMHKSRLEREAATITDALSFSDCQHPARKRYDVLTLDGELCAYLCAACGTQIPVAAFLEPSRPIQAYPDPPAQRHTDASPSSAAEAPPVKAQASKRFPIDEAMRRNDEQLRLLFRVPHAQLSPVARVVCARYLFTDGPFTL